MSLLIKKHELLPLVAQYIPERPVIVEAGAFTGSDTIKMVTQWPQAIIHAFEPVPSIFEQLQKKSTQFKQIHTYNLALSSHTGTAQFHVAQNPTKTNTICQAGSLLNPTERLTWSPVTYPHTISVNTITLDQWATEYTISQIDFLWLDVQGHELSVLQSSPQIIDTLTALYLEVHFINAYEGQASYEQINQWLADHHFIEVARDFVNTTQWFFGNILYIKQPY